LLIAFPERNGRLTKWLNKIFQNNFSVKKILEEGDDINLVHNISNKSYSVEAKNDTWYRSGNMALEIISNDNKQSPGWFYYCESDLLCYLTEHEYVTKEIFILHPKTFRETLSPLEQYKFKKRSILNRGYRTIIYTAPLNLLKEIYFNNTKTDINFIEDVKINIHYNLNGIPEELRDYIEQI
jgi:hypothetical protein